MEFRLDADLRLNYGLRAVSLIILTAILGALGLATGIPIATIGAGITAVAALAYGANWFARLTACTRVTPSGIEARTFRSKKIAWADIKDIQVMDFEKVGSVEVRGGPRAAGGNRNSGGGNKKVACVRIVRHRGRRIELPAPLVIRDSSDSAFDEKVDALKSAHAFYTHAQAGAPSATS